MLSVRMGAWRKRRAWVWPGLLLASLIVPWLKGCQSVDQNICYVNSIYDGDTMRLTCQGKKVKVRLYCIDAPEMTQRPWGRESRDYLRAITPKRVKLVQHHKDRYGRIVGEVWSADDDEAENLNLAMVWAGRAVVYPRYCSEAKYYQAEKSARAARAGVWSKRGAWQRPWETRRKARARK